MRSLSAVAFLLLVLSANARADVSPPPFAPCLQKEAGERCFDAYGRPGRCEHDPGIGCVLDGPATSASASASTSAPAASAGSAHPTDLRNSSCDAGRGGASNVALYLFVMISFCAVWRTR